MGLQERDPVEGAARGQCLSAVYLWTEMSIKVPGKALTSGDT